MWLREQRLKCPDCGTRYEESDPKKGGDLNAYHASRFTCYACQHVEQAYADGRIKDGKKKGQLPLGFKVRLLPNYVWRERQRLRRQKKILADHKIATEKAEARRERHDGRQRQVI